MAIAGLALFAVVMFRVALSPSQYLLTSDNNISMMPSLKGILPQGFFSHWVDNILVGASSTRVPFSWSYVFLWLMPAKFGFNWIYAVDVLLASVFLALFLRFAGLHWSAVALGLLTAFWVGSNLTLIYAGHMGKFGSLMFAAAGLYGVRQTFNSDQPWLWSIVTGGALGCMFMEQPDVALFFGMFLGAYALFLAVRLALKGNRLKGFVLLISMGGVALMISGATLLDNYVRNISAVDVMQKDDPRQKWEFVTQWSWPPEESIDFIAPGYTGWRSGDQDGPYWGRMGRSAGWEQTRAGFMNFKLESQYLGILPLGFAILAFIALGLKAFPGGCSAGAERITSARLEVIFWGSAALIALLLSFGKFFPLFELFYQLPVVASIRNPNKFLQIFQLTLGILSAYGLQSVLTAAEAADAVVQKRKS